MLQSPGGNWSNYQILHSGTLAWSVPLTLSSPLDLFVKDVLAPTVSALVKDIKTLYDDLSAYHSRKLTLNQLLRKLGTDFLMVLLDTMETLVRGLLKFAAELIAIARDLLNRKVADIPFIGGFVSWLFEDEDAPGTGPTFLDGFALVAAIPATIGFKLLTGKSPFDTSIGLPLSDYQHIIPSTVSHMRPMAVASVDPLKEMRERLERNYSYIGGLVAAFTASIEKRD